MSIPLIIPVKLLVPLLAFGGIGLAILPADFHAISNVKVVGARPAKTAPSFNVAPMPIEAIHKAPAISEPLPVQTVTASVEPGNDLRSPAESWQTAWVIRLPPTPAAPANLERVNAAVNVRADGRKGAPILFVLPAGSEVRTAERQGGWVHIYSDQGEGWIFSSFIGAPRAAPPLAADDGIRSNKRVRVAGNVTVRDAPGGEPVYQLEAGEPIRIVETHGKWARIVTSTGEGGWVRVR